MNLLLSNSCFVQFLHKLFKNSFINADKNASIERQQRLRNYQDEDDEKKIALLKYFWSLNSQIKNTLFSGEIFSASNYIYISPFHPSSKYAIFCTLHPADVMLFRL